MGGNREKEGHGYQHRTQLGYDAAMTELAAETAEAEGLELNRRERRALARKQGKKK